MEKPNSKYVHNGLWILLEKASRILSGILVGIFVLRFLGPAQYGTISYALSVVAIFTIISTLGLDSLVVRELVERKQDRDRILGTAFWLRFIGGICVVAIATFYSSLKDTPDRTMAVFIVSISIVLQSLSVVDFYFQSEVKGKFTAMNQVFTLSLSACVKLLLIYIQAPLFWFIWMVVLEAFLTAVFQLYFYHKQGLSIRYWRFSKMEAFELFKYTWPIILSAFVQMLYQKSNEILILRFTRSMDMVGLYSAAARLSEASYFIPVALTAAILPGLMNNKDNRELQDKRLAQLCSLLFWMAVSMIVFIQFFGDWVVTTFYKNKFQDSVSVLKIHIWSLIPVFFGTVLGTRFLADNRQKVIIIYQLINFAFYLSFSFYFIPKYHGDGAALSIMLTYYVGFFVTIFTYRPKENVRLFLRAIHPGQIPELFRYLKSVKK